MYMRYQGASDEQVKWGGGHDPRAVLTEGEAYEVEDIEVHSWHTRVRLVGINGWFNSVCFSEVEKPREAGRD